MNNLFLCLIDAIKNRPYGLFSEFMLKRQLYKTEFNFRSIVFAKLNIEMLYKTILITMLVTEAGRSKTGRNPAADHSLLC